MCQHQKYENVLSPKDTTERIERHLKWTLISATLLLVANVVLVILLAD